MTAYKLIGKLLKFKGFRCVGLAFRRGGRLDVLVKPFKNGCRCPECGRRGKIVRQRAEPRYWRDIPVGPWSVWLMYWPREIHCSTHGRVSERLPWADAESRVTYRLEYLMLRYCQIMSQKAAAKLLRLPASTLSDLLHRLIRRLRDGHRIRGSRPSASMRSPITRATSTPRWSTTWTGPAWSGSARARGARPLIASSTRR